MKKERDWDFICIKGSLGSMVLAAWVMVIQVGLDAMGYKADIMDLCGLFLVIGMTFLSGFMVATYKF